MHVVGQDDLISIAQFDLDQHQNISSPQTECNSLCPYIKQQLLLHLIVVTKHSCYPLLYLESTATHSQKVGTTCVVSSIYSMTALWIHILRYPLFLLQRTVTNWGQNVTWARTGFNI
jgi:hypothetical protein